MKSLAASILLLISFPSACLALSSQTFNRRNFFQVAAASVATTSIIAPAFALDMDAFTKQELKQDVPVLTMSPDESLCKFGAPGSVKGEACVRAGMPTAGKGGKGVDAFGNVDRGDFVRCITTYPMIDGQYVKTVTCS